VDGSRLIHLNGPPGIGKSTIARRYAADHAGVLNLDVDRLRSFIGGVGFLEAGDLVRPLAVAMIGAHLGQGHDVVFPQMLVDPEEITEFENAARGGGGEYVGIVLTADQDSVISRFHGREPTAAEPWHEDILDVVADRGGDRVLTEYHGGLLSLAASRPGDIIVTTADGDVAGTYASVLSVLAGRTGAGRTGAGRTGAG
jgi:predicted kinase